MRSHGWRAALLVAGTVLGAGVLGAQTEPETQPRPTPPQRFFDWTEMGFAPAEYQRRREALMAALADSGGGVYLTRSHEGTSHGETFRQLDDFLYFTGLELPRSVLAIDADTASPTPPDAAPARRAGPRRARPSGPW